MVEYLRTIAARATGTERIEQESPQRRIVIRVQVKPLRRGPAAPVPKLTRVMESVHRRSDGGPADSRNRAPEVVRESSFTNTVHAIDGDANHLLLFVRRNKRCELLYDRFKLTHSVDGFQLSSA